MRISMMSATMQLPMNLELRIQPARDVVVLHCGGEITAGDTAQAFRSAVVELLHQHDNVVVDLGGIQCMDRRGLETIVSLYSSARTAQARVRFANLAIGVSDSRDSGKNFQKLAG